MSENKRQPKPNGIHMHNVTVCAIGVTGTCSVIPIGPKNKVKGSPTGCGTLRQHLSLFYNRIESEKGKSDSAR